ncbi:MAG TPA: stalk domain-containing protein [Clostridia bacterium]|nr:stalk domain-containing protein [Clostridia bacterium]
MTGFKKRLLPVIVILIVIAAATIPTAYADNVPETVQAYPGVKIIYNGQELTDEKQPYIIDSSTYVPLRMLMNSFGKEISYDSTMNMVIINNKVNAEEESLTIRINELNAKVSSLQNENSKLKTENAALKSENTALTNKVSAFEYDYNVLIDMEDELTDEYEDAGEDYLDDKEIIVTITLDGDDEALKLFVTLDFDGSDDNDDLTELTKSGIKRLLNDVIDSLKDLIEDTVYEDADITGLVEDEDDNTLKYDGSTYDYSW